MTKEFTPTVSLESTDALQRGGGAPRQPNLTEEAIGFESLSVLNQESVKFIIKVGMSEAKEDGKAAESGHGTRRMRIPTPPPRV